MYGNLPIGSIRIHKISIFSDPNNPTKVLNSDQTATRINKQKQWKMRKETTRKSKHKNK
jgi:hypothetical protein